MLERMWNNWNSTILKVGMKNTIKDIYVKPIANIIINDERLKDFPLKSRTRQGFPLSPLLFNILLEVLARLILGKKKIKHPN